MTLGEMTLQELGGYVGEGVLLADGFEAAFVGVMARFGQEPIAVYDMGKCLEILQETSACSWLEAIEHFDFNVIGGWVGTQTPGFLVVCSVEELRQHYADTLPASCDIP